MTTRWRGWSGRSEVERVELYTVTMVQVLMWVMLPLLTLSAPVARHPELSAVLVAGSLVLALPASRLLGVASRAYPTSGPPPRRLALTALVLLAAAEGASLLMPARFGFVGGEVVCVALAWAFGGFRGRRTTAALLLAVTAAPFLVTPFWGAAVVGLGLGGFLVFTIRSSLWLLGVVTELDRARGAQAALAVAEERLRFSRDVHDVLGRRLSTIAVQAELAATLARRGDPSAPDRMAEVRATAHDGLREARELARGYRPTSLTQELDGARSLLGSAGIACRVDVPDLPPQWHEAAGWVVREATTNVLRHSAASTVEISYDGRRLLVRNDGATGDTGPGGEGSGLVGLSERLAPLGAVLLTRREGADHVLEVVLPTPAARTADRTVAPA